YALFQFQQVRFYVLMKKDLHFVVRELCFEFAQYGHWIGRQLLQGGCYAGFRPCPVNDDCVETLDLEQSVELALEKGLSLVGSSVDDAIIVFLERDLRPVCLKQVLVNVKPRAEDLESCFEPLDRIFLGGLVEAFVINATDAQNNSQVPGFRD